MPPPPDRTRRAAPRSVPAPSGGRSAFSSVPRVGRCAVSCRRGPDRRCLDQLVSSLRRRPGQISAARPPQLSHPTKSSSLSRFGGGGGSSTATRPVEGSCSFRRQSPSLSRGAGDSIRARRVLPTPLREVESVQGRLGKNPVSKGRHLGFPARRRSGDQQIRGRRSDRRVKEGYEGALLQLARDHQ